MQARSRQGRACLVETHRFNFLHALDASLATLEAGLNAALGACPAVRFLTPLELARAIQTRDPAWIEAFLAQPLAARRAFADKARAASGEHQSALKAQGALETITDVNADTVAATMARYGVRRLIHGHTHRPAIHALQVGGRSAIRVVLGDWYEQGSVLRLDADGLALSAL